VEDSLGECELRSLRMDTCVVATCASPCWAMQDPPSMRWTNRSVYFGGCIDELYLFWISMGMVTRYSTLSI
jgi:hypothetical protein